MFKKVIPKLFFTNFEQLEREKKNKNYRRICRLALFMWSMIMLPISVKFSIIVSDVFEYYDNKILHFDMLTIAKYIFPIYALGGFFITLISYSSDFHCGKRASAFSWLICLSSMISTYFVCNLLDDSLHQLITVAVSILLSLFLYANTPGLIEKPVLKTRIISGVILTSMILIVVLLPIYTVHLNIDLGKFIKTIHSLMKGG